MVRFANIDLDTKIVLSIFSRDEDTPTNRLIGSLVVLTEEELPEVGYLYLDDVFYQPTSPEIFEYYKTTVYNPVRQKIFSDTQWIRERHEDRISLGIDDTENWLSWLNYWQSLRDLPSVEGFDPLNPILPLKPE